MASVLPPWLLTAAPSHGSIIRNHSMILGCLVSKIRESKHTQIVLVPRIKPKESPESELLVLWSVLLDLTKVGSGVHSHHFFGWRDIRTTHMARSDFTWKTGNERQSHKFRWIEFLTSRLQWCVCFFFLMVINLYWWDWISNPVKNKSPNKSWLLQQPPHLCFATLLLGLIYTGMENDLYSMENDHPTLLICSSRYAGPRIPRFRFSPKITPQTSSVLWALLQLFTFLLQALAVGMVQDGNFNGGFKQGLLYVPLNHRKNR